MIVLWRITAAPWKTYMPPPTPVALLPEMVELRIVGLPDSIRIPPPFAAEFPLIVLSVIVESPL